MLKKVTIFAVSVLSFLGAAAQAQELDRLIQMPSLPPADEGIVIKPENQLPHYEMLKESIKKDRASVKKYGYIRRSSPEAQVLLNFQKGLIQFSPKNLTATADTGLYRSIHDIQMAYRYYGVPASAMTNELAVAPAGTYLQGQGWTGAAQTFEKAGLGICNYNEMNAKLNHGSVLVARENVSYDINGKVTQKYAKGEENEGFIYGVGWYDDTIYHELECVQMTFSPDTMRSVVNLAIVIDNNAH